MERTSSNPLTWLPAKVKAPVYGLLSLAALIYFAYQAADGDWMEAVGSILVTLGFGTALSNVSPGKAKPPRNQHGYMENPWIVLLVMFAVAIICIAVYATFFADGKNGK